MGGEEEAMAEPFPGLKIAAPERTPQQGEVVIRYEVREPKTGCCQCSDMNQSGLIALVALIFVCWPLACIPCCMKSCHESYPRFEGSAAAAAGAVRWSLTNSVPRRVVHNSS